MGRRAALVGLWLVLVLGSVLGFEGWLGARRRSSRMDWALAAKKKGKATKKSAAGGGGGFGKPVEQKPKSNRRASRIPTDDTTPCGCFCGKSYAECCAPYHRGEAYPSEPLALVRARYSAFNFRDIEFIVDSTHPENELFGDRKTMVSRLDQNCYDDFDFVALGLPA